ncbi:MAG: hypothetical protein DWI24_09450 [Planctomycetota bacterium]|nr:MAG: hypothetical protein DWI24_09450 [Planctomycetota bacterium]
MIFSLLSNTSKLLLQNTIRKELRNGRLFFVFFKNNSTSSEKATFKPKFLTILVFFFNNVSQPIKKVGENATTINRRAGLNLYPIRLAIKLANHLDRIWAIYEKFETP